MGEEVIGGRFHQRGRVLSERVGPRWGFFKGPIAAMPSLYSVGAALLKGSHAQDFSGFPCGRRAHSANYRPGPRLRRDVRDLSRVPFEKRLIAPRLSGMPEIY